MKNKLLLFAILASLVFFSCGKKKEEPKKEVKREVVKPKVAVKKDSAKKIVEQPKPVPVKKVDNKYFLIAASFVKENNANIFRDKLESQGYDAEVIVRNSGRNQDFFKVAYKAFSDKDEAFKQLSMAKKEAPFEGVWLLIKD